MKRHPGKIIFFQLVFYFVMTQFCLGQNPCIYQEIKSQRLNLNKSLQLKREAWLKNTETMTPFHFSRSIIRIPVVFHVVYFNDEQNVELDQIESQLERINQDFSASNPDLASVPSIFKRNIANTGIQFCLADQDPQGQPSSGIVRVPTSKDLIGLRSSQGGRKDVFYDDLDGSDVWDTERYLNIYVCDLGEIGGFASAPFTAKPAEDAVVINYKYFGENQHPQFNMGRIVTHELGHFFDLEHAWGELPDCESDDGIADTPRQFGPYFGCPAGLQISCETVDMHMNFMDYVDDACMHMFTAGQKLRMLTAVAGPRSSLLQQSVCENSDTLIDINDISIFPNPVSQGPVLLSGWDENPVTSWSLYNLNGQLLSESSGFSSVLVSVPVDHLPAGLYILKGSSALEDFVFKVLKID